MKMYHVVERNLLLLLSCLISMITINKANLSKRVHARERIIKLRSWHFVSLQIAKFGISGFKFCGLGSMKRDHKMGEKKYIK